MEFRTRPPGGESGAESQSSSSSNDIVETAFKQFLDRVQEDEQAQVQIAGALQDNYGVPPQLLAPVFPALQGEIEAQEQAQEPQPGNRQGRATIEGGQEQQAQAQEQPQIQQQHMPTKAEDTDSSTEAEVTPEQITELLDSIMAILGEDTTLEELQLYIEDNPDLVKREIENYIG